jgi:hypothetical protein
MTKEDTLQTLLTQADYLRSIVELARLGRLSDGELARDVASVLCVLGAELSDTMHNWES